ncbi:TldD/PmbA family protein [Luminiphilus syltensis NOR5-1B]|uniref:TldD/PmbA family protein n=1 Tax=Luminiphilus syltensis NOR5-1B TaxID=565045 RepID=B8KX67_9GAMM|nr:metallopeptidase TldD-related protein [Luminiphilus syltensis]EED36304.1 TldD/PmbA family protein [Luminiphilus syltensis NOR5-1B]
MEHEAHVVAQQILESMHHAGFEESRVSVTFTEQDELNIAHNEPALLRSTEDYNLAISGIVDGRKASTTLSDIDSAAIGAAISSIRDSVSSAPQDEANRFSADQHMTVEQGPLECDRDLLSKKALELLEFRAATTPKVMIEEFAASHRLRRSCELTSRDTTLSSVVGCYSLGGMCIASEGGKTSSLNFTGGNANDLSEKMGSEWFGLGEMLRDTERQIHTRALGPHFTGAVVLAPTAVTDLVSWFLQQLGSRALIAGSSVYRQSVGEAVAAPTLSLQSDFSAAGHTPFSTDGFIAPAITLIDNGILTSLLPDLYSSLKTGSPHTPSASSWRISPGAESRKALIEGVERGALVTRFSMGRPAANGDFSGVIKNSFIIEDGAVGEALSETMVAGNMKQMLRDINGISKEHINYGGEDFPWIRIPNMHFS